MGQRLGIAGFPNSGKSWGRRYIPDGERVMIIAPSKKSSYLYTGPANAQTLTPEQLDDAVEKGTRVPVADFDLMRYKGDGTVAWKGFDALRFNWPKEKPGVEILPREALRRFMLKAPWITPKELLGNVMYCDNLEDLNVYLDFIDTHLPFIHTVILPDFTHYVAQILTSLEFRNKQFGNDQYKKYLDLAADSLRNFITRSDLLRPDLMVVTEFHIQLDETKTKYELFVPGGTMLKEKFLPSSYYDIFLWTDVQYALEESQPNTYSYITRGTSKWPEARSLDLKLDVRIPNNLQTVLTEFRRKKNIPVKY